MWRYAHILYSLCLLSPLTTTTTTTTLAMFGSEQQKPVGVYDGSENIPGQVYEFKDAELLDEAISEGFLPVVDRVFPPQIMAQFLEAISWEMMPGNVTSNLTLLTVDEIFELAARPYAEWAPAPYDKQPGQIFQNVQIRIASHEDATGLQVTEKNIQAMKSRLWEDVMPLTRNQWRRKRLDEPEQFDLACQYLGAAVDAFAYLNVEAIQSSLRDVFNNIASEWKVFGDAVNALRAVKGEPEVSVTALWEEFVRLRWSIMTTRTHDWVMEHVDGLRAPLIEQLRQHEPPSLDTLSTEQWNITNKLHLLAEIAARAGFTVMLPMDGYTDYKAPEGQSERPSPNIDVRRQAYSQSLKRLTSAKQWSRLYLGRPGEHDPGHKMFRDPADPASLVEGILDQKEAQQELRKEYNGHTTVQLGAEDWILKMKREMDKEEHTFDKWGFVMYRITYEQSDAEWDEFLQTFQADINDWGDGVVGADLIRDSAQLRWIDGRDVGIAEGDYKAATEHFLTLREQDDFQVKSDWDEEVFLFVDVASVNSYIRSLEDTLVDLQPYGDYGGFVTAVDARFDPDDPGDHAEESPGFTGRMRVSGSLLWSDLFALGKAQAASAEDLWPLAMHHPWEVYVGPVVNNQREAWAKAKRTYANDAAFQRFASQD